MLEDSQEKSSIGYKADFCDLNTQLQNDYSCPLIRQTNNMLHEVLDRLSQKGLMAELQSKLSLLIDRKFSEFTEKMIGFVTSVNGQQQLALKEKFMNSQLPGKIEHVETPNWLEDSCDRFKQQLQEDDQSIENSSLININETTNFYDFEQFSQNIELSRDMPLIERDDGIRVFQDNTEILSKFKNVFKEMKLEFRKCDIVFQYPQMKDRNFHEFIDRSDNLLFLAELQNSQIVGGFTNLSFHPEPDLIPRPNDKSFLCNFKRNLFAFASRFNKTLSYDENYLIFGNWELKVRCKSDVLETNWGTNGDCFRSKKYGQSEMLSTSVKQFFGEGAQRKKLRIKRYSFYVLS